MLGRILLVDDDATVRTSLSEALAEAGFDVRTADSAESAVEQLPAYSPEVVLSDVRMQGLDGIGLLKLIRERTPDIDVVLMTAFDDMPTVATAMREGAAEFLVKPIPLDHLIGVLGRVLEDRQLRQRSRERRQDVARLDDIVGRDASMIQIYKTIGQAATSRATVLVRGESGTGKELIARAVHYHSAYAREPFVAVNCAALPSTLLESELFGHVRGAFTGAVNARRGAFALAGKGTIFLDEIGDTTLDFQSKLLRVLQNREYQPVGSERVEHTDARVVAATHQALEQLIRDGKFREDLYYRLRVVEIRVPPLRERPADIPVLAQHLIRRACAVHECAEPLLSREAVRELERHTWPGNVRELENTLTRAVVLAAGGVIRPEHLRMGAPAEETPAHIPSLTETERAHIVKVLELTRGQKSRAAQILGVSRPRLNRLLEKHGLA